MSLLAAEERHLSSSSFQSSSSVESSISTFQTLESEELDNDASPGGSNHILLTPLAEEDHHTATAERRERNPQPAGLSNTAKASSSTPQPVAKPRTLHMNTVPSNSPTDSTHSGLSSSPLPRRFSNESFSETPPTPRPRPRSGEQMRQKVNELEMQLTKKGVELVEALSKIAELEQVKERERRGSNEVQRVRAESVALRRALQERNSDLKEKEGLLQRKTSQIAGLEGELTAFKQPHDPKRRLEVRLSEAIGRVKELETEQDLFRKEREREREEARVILEGLESEKIEMERERQQWEAERETHSQEVRELRAQLARLEQEKTAIETKELQQTRMARDGLGKEAERLRERVSELESQLTQEKEGAKLAEENRQRSDSDLQGQLRGVREELEREKQQLMQQCESLQQSARESQAELASLKQELAALSSARDTAEEALMAERAKAAQLGQECKDLQRMCEEYTIEINSLLKDLDQNAGSLGALREERDKLRSQVDGLQRNFAEKQGHWKKMEQEMERGGEREKRLQAQRDSLQNRQEIMDLQLKQYQSDFDEERKAREELSKVVHHLEARDKDSVAQIAQLRRHVNELSTEKNDLAFQLEQLKLQLPPPLEQ